MFCELGVANNKNSRQRQNAACGAPEGFLLGEALASWVGRGKGEGRMGWRKEGGGVEVELGCPHL